MDYFYSKQINILDKTDKHPLDIVYCSSPGITFFKGPYKSTSLASLTQPTSGNVGQMFLLAHIILGHYSLLLQYEIMQKLVT